MYTRLLKSHNSIVDLPYNISELLHYNLEGFVQELNMSEMEITGCSSGNGVTRCGDSSVNWQGQGRDNNK